MWYECVCVGRVYLQMRGQHTIMQSFSFPTSNAVTQDLLPKILSPISFESDVKGNSIVSSTQSTSIPKEYKGTNIHNGSITLSINYQTLYRCFIIDPLIVP